MFSLPRFLFSWTLRIWSSSWLAARPCFQKTHQCGSKTWQDTSTSIWLHQRLSPHSAATLTVCHKHVLLCFTPNIQNHAVIIQHSLFRLKLHVIIVNALLIYLNLSAMTPCTFCIPDYPYCLIGKELRSIIKGLIGRCSDILPDFFDHCVYTMLRELDRQSGRCKLLHKGMEVVWVLSVTAFTVGTELDLLPSAVLQAYQ